MYLDGGSREEEPVGSVGRVQVVLNEGGSMSSINYQHIVQPPARLVALWALGGLLRPAESNAISPGVMRQGKQVDNGTTVGRGSRTKKNIQNESLECVWGLCLCNHVLHLYL